MLKQWYLADTFQVLRSRRLALTVNGRSILTQNPSHVSQMQARWSLAAFEKVM